MIPKAASGRGLGGAGDGGEVMGGAVGRAGVMNGGGGEVMAGVRSGKEDEARWGMGGGLAESRNQLWLCVCVCVCARAPVCVRGGVRGT